MQRLEQEAVLDVCHHLLAGSIRKLDAVDIAACKPEKQPYSPEFVSVTLPTPIPDAAALRTFKYRNPNNVAIVDEKGNWTGVVTYFREWEGFIGAAVQHLNVRAVHAAEL